MERNETEKKKEPEKKGDARDTAPAKEKIGEEPAVVPKSGWAALSVVGLIVLAITGLVIYRLYQRNKPPPPVTKETFISSSVTFYGQYLEALESLVKGQALFRRGRALMGNNPETLPESAEETASASPMFRAAENFSLAVEQISHAEDLMKSELQGLPPQDRDCREAMQGNFKKYREAAKIFNEYVKARYQGDEAKAEKFALSDGTAKWTMAESLMAKDLADGCNGGFFGYVRDQSPNFRGRVFEAYRAFYGDQFSQRVTKLSLLMGYIPLPGDRPSPSPSPFSPSPAR